MAIKIKKPREVGTLQLPALNEAAQGVLGGANAAVPQPWSRENNPWYQQQQTLLGQLNEREPYRFDADASALYQAIKDNTIRQGQRAMQDTMGQAAGLTGGYGSTYAQGAGQQAYNEFLTRLNDQIPDIAAQERAAYDAETQALLQRLSLAGSMYQQDYGEAMAERDYQHQLGREAVADAQAARDEEWRQQQFEYGKEQDALANALAQQKWDYGVAQDALDREDKQRDEAYDRAWKLIQFSLTYGTTPTDADLQAAGLTRDQFNTARALTQAQAAGRGTPRGPQPHGSDETAALPSVPTDVLNQLANAYANSGGNAGAIAADMSALQNQGYDTDAAYDYIVQFYNNIRAAQARQNQNKPGMIPRYTK